MRHLRRHANALAQRGVRVDGLADVHRVCAHLVGHLGGGVGHAGDDAGVEGGGCKLLVGLQFTRNHVGGDFLAVGSAAYGLQDQVLGRRLGTL